VVRGREGVLRIEKRIAFVLAVAAALTAAALAPSDAHDAASQAWPAFVLVAGRLVIGALAAEDGLFAAAGATVARMPGGGVRLLAVLLLFEACVTAVLNLDTAVVFLTPVLLHAARRATPWSRRGAVSLRRRLHGELRLAASPRIEPDKPDRARAGPRPRSSLRGADAARVDRRRRDDDRRARTRVSGNAQA
jgi:hypothetical protein